ncbi:MAG: hypothetical protein LIO99_10570 [Clostridiales bacterium]|nr:hypothetical protein [Clostridiales bacterium]
MTTTMTILITGILLVWLCFSIVFVIDGIQGLINGHRHEKREQASEARELEYRKAREKREQEQAARDLEYREKRMKELE